MKRLAAIILLLALLPLTASASLPEPVTAEQLPQALTVFINAYNSFADTFAVQHLPFDGWNKHNSYYYVSIGNVDYQFREDSYGTTAAIIATQENANLDFLAECACISAAVYGFTPDIYTDLMTVYIALRTTPKGENVQHKSSGGIMLMTDRGDLIAFMVTK